MRLHFCRSTVAYGGSRQEFDDNRGAVEECLDTQRIIEAGVKDGVGAEGLSILKQGCKCLSKARPLYAVIQYPSRRIAVVATAIMLPPGVGTAERCFHSDHT
jgi:hypothetical protein